MARQDDLVKNCAVKDLKAILEDCEGAKRKRQLLKAASVFFGIAAIGILIILGYFLVDSRIPSVIRVRAGQEQTFDLGIPAVAEVIPVSESGNSNIPAGCVDIDLSRDVTVKMNPHNTYNLKVKLFGILPFKEVGMQTIEATELIPVGRPIGLYVETKGVLVIGTASFSGEDGETYAPAKNILQTGDYVTAVNGRKISMKQELISVVEESAGSILSLSVLRGGSTHTFTITPIKDTTGKYKLGIWIRDNSQGIGTMTFIDSKGNFGALGHGITDVDTGALMELNLGTLYETGIVGITRGLSGKPGEMTGMITYNDTHILGDITQNKQDGIYGKVRTSFAEKLHADPVPIGLKQEIEKGPAKILCTLNEEPEYFDIEITAVHVEYDRVNRGIEFKVIDEDLLKTTGGIVQGMSGSPILQNGKIIGAVTHVLINDPTRGYGIFIENMLQNVE